VTGLHIDAGLGAPVAEDVLEIETTTKLIGDLAERLISSAAAEGKTPVDMMADIVERGLRRHAKAVNVRDGHRAAAAAQRQIEDVRRQLQAALRQVDDLNGKLRAAEQTRNERALTFAGDIEQFLKSEARDRKMTVELLLRAIIEAVVEDRLFAAVLDN
jgi:hypothetical protein